MCACVFAGVLGGGARAQDAAREHAEAAFGAGEVAVAEGLTYAYRLLTPPTGSKQPEEGWPLVVFLHGAGERGDDNKAQLAYLPERMAAEECRARFPCYLLALQCPAEERWTSANWSAPEPGPMAEEPDPSLRAVMLAIERLVREEPVDLRRIYLTGLSMGGFGTWELAARKPEWFAAVAPICGGGDPERAAAYKGLPIWAWHDEADPAVPVERTRIMVEAAEDAGAIVSYSETTGYGHASWRPAYEPDNLPAWMFGQRRESASDELTAVRARAE
jgi:predicted peptidase